MRTLKDIVWAKGKDPSKDHLFALLIKVNNYISLTFGKTRCMLIFEVIQEFIQKEKNYSKIQFAICLSQAITIHKSQGFTLLKVIMNLNKKDFIISLLYIAVSCVKIIKDIFFEFPFNLKRFAQQPSFLSLDRDVDYAYKAFKIL